MKQLIAVAALVAIIGVASPDAFAQVPLVNQQITWDPPVIGVADGYEVQFRKVGAANWTDHPHGGTATAATIGIEQGVAYEFRVRPFNQQADGPWEIVTKTLTVGRLVVSPSSLDLTSGTGGSAATASFTIRSVGGNANFTITGGGPRPVNPHAERTFPSVAQLTTTPTSGLATATPTLITVSLQCSREWDSDYGVNLTVAGGSGPAQSVSVAVGCSGCPTPIGSRLGRFDDSPLRCDVWYAPRCEWQRGVAPEIRRRVSYDRDLRVVDPIPPTGPLPNPTQLVNYQITADVPTARRSSIPQSLHQYLPTISWSGGSTQQVADTTVQNTLNNNSRRGWIGMNRHGRSTRLLTPSFTTYTDTYGIDREASIAGGALVWRLNGGAYRASMTVTTNPCYEGCTTIQDVEVRLSTDCRGAAVTDN